MNIKLLKRVQTRLRRMRHPKHFDMHEWARTNECGTSACIAGHVLLMNGYKTQKPKDGYGGDSFLEFTNPATGRVIQPMLHARKLLGITKDQARRLFRVRYWPDEFVGGVDTNEELTDAPYNNPKVAADRIQAFIDSRGAR